MSAYPFKLIPALDYAEQLGAELLETKQRMIALWDDQIRIGGDYRNGPEISAADLSRAFGVGENTIGRWKRNMGGESPAV